MKPHQVEAARWGTQGVDALLRGDERTARACFCRAHEVLADAAFAQEAIARLLPPASPLVDFGHLQPPPTQMEA